MDPNVRQRNMLIIGVLVVVVVVAAAVVILLSGNTTGSGLNFDNIPQSRTEDGAFVLGNPDAPITVVEFADFTCPHCQDYVGDVTRFITEYVATGKAKFEYRMLRTTGSQYGDFAAQLAECSETVKPGSFWKAHERIFTLAAAGLYSDIGRDVAKTIGAEYGTLLECTSNAKQFQADSLVGQQAGVTGTPAVMIRFENGPLQWITIGGQTYNRGGVPFSTLAQVVLAVEASS
jgi:protein-disulfide isomerase